jgi:hypothetical protein
MNFWTFLTSNSPANLALLFLLGVIFGVLGLKFFKRIFWLFLILALLFALSKTDYLKNYWPFSFANKDKLEKILKNSPKNAEKNLLEEEIQK